MAIIGVGLIGGSVALAARERLEATVTGYDDSAPALAAALSGGARWGWLPNLLLWAALVTGSLCGALAYHWINLAAIWFAAAAALVLAGFCAATAKRRD